MKTGVSVFQYAHVVVVFACLWTGTGAVGREGDVNRKPSLDTCNSTSWDHVNIRIPSVPEPMGGVKGSVCTSNVPFVLVEEVIWRCEKRYCCVDHCQCGDDTLTEDPCMPRSPRLFPTELICLVQHKRPPRFYRYVCCKDFVEVDTQCISKINCDDADGSGCAHDCVRVNGTDTCTCRDGYQLTNRTRCTEVSAITPSTLMTTTSTSTTLSTTSIVTTITSTLSTKTTVTTTAEKSTPTTTKSTKPMATPIITIAKSPTMMQPNLTSVKPTKTTKTKPTTTVMPTTATTVKLTTPTTVNLTTTMTTAVTMPPHMPLTVRQGTSLWILVVLPLIAVLMLFIGCFFVLCQKRKPHYIAHEDVQTTGYENVTYGYTSTGMEVIRPEQHMTTKKSCPPITAQVASGGDHPKSIKMVEDDFYVATVKAGSSKEPTVVYENYISRCMNLDEDDGYLKPVVSVYASGLPPPYQEEDQYAVLEEGAVGGAPLPIKDPLQSYKMEQTENKLNTKIEENTYYEIP